MIRDHHRARKLLYLTVFSHKRGARTYIVLAFLMVLQFCGKGQMGRDLNLLSLSLSSSQTAAKYVFHQARLKQGDIHMYGKKVSPTQQSLSASSTEQQCIKSAVNSVLRNLWERSLENPSLSYWYAFRNKSYYTEKENILFPIAITDSMRNNRSHLHRVILEKQSDSYAQKLPGSVRKGGIAWDGVADWMKSLPSRIFGDSQKPSLHSSTTNSVVLTMYSMMWNSIS